MRHGLKARGFANASMVVVVEWQRRDMAMAKAKT